MEGKPSSIEMPRRKLKETQAFRAIMLGVVVLLLITSAFYYYAASDSRQAKYRAQSLLVLQLIADVETAGGVISAFDEEVSVFMRYSRGDAIERNLMDVGSDSLVIAAMYSSSSSKAETFQLLNQASTEMWYAFYDELDYMWDNLTVGTFYEKNTTLESKLVVADDLLQDIDPLLREGIDNSRDWEASPYSMVDRMDLRAIADLCSQIVNVMGS